MVVNDVCEMLDDTALLVGSEIWMADLSFYQTVRQAARRDVPWADTIYDDLKERFPGLAGDPEEEPSPHADSADALIGAARCPFGGGILKNDRF